MQARNEAQYRAAWESHVLQLNTLAMAADVSYEELTALRAQLAEWIDKAAAVQTFQTAEV